MAVTEYGVDIKVLKKLDSPIFVDYLWYRTGQINHASPADTPPHPMLMKYLARACKEPSAYEFMRNYNPRDENPFELQRWICTLENEFHEKCLTEKNYDWLENKNTRLNCFIWRLISHITIRDDSRDQILDKNYDFVIHPSLVDENIKIHTSMDSKKNSNVSMQNIISTINRLPCNKAAKEKLARAISELSESIMKNDEITAWFKKHNKDKVSWLHHYLEHKRIDYTPLVLNSTAAQKDDLISFFDVLSVVNIDRYKLLVSNIKKAWSQKVYRDKNLEKKQYSINMSKDIGDILDKLSQVENKNKNAIIEELIREAYARQCSR